MKKIGKLNNISIDNYVLQKEHEIEWKISNFSSFPRGGDNCFKSPLFSFANESWSLWIHLMGIQQNGSYEVIGLHLGRQSPGPHISIECTVGFKTFNGKKVSEHHRQHIFKNGEAEYRVSAFIKRCKLYERKSDLMPDDQLTVFCNLKYPKHVETTSLSEEVRNKGSDCQKALEALDNISSHQKKSQECGDVIAFKKWCDHQCQLMGAKDLSEQVRNKGSYCQKALEALDNISCHQKKCLECGNVIALKNWSDHKCQLMGAKVSEKLLNDLKKMVLNGEHSDVIIKVKEEQFHLHKNILAVRNPFFHAMFRNDMKENTTGIVSIDDCEPDIFRTFIHFVYTGKVDKLSSENACDLYEVADKYQEDQLKEECLHFIANMMSVDSVCDIIVLALRYGDKKLLQDATKFFCGRTKEIIRSVKWQTFLAKYPTQANELYIKAFDDK